MDRATGTDTSIWKSELSKLTDKDDLKRMPEAGD